MRFSVFVDAGMVYPKNDIFDASGLRYSGKVDLGELRYSAGLAFNWYSPVGPLSISFARALNDEPGDDTETIQFTLGTPLR
jgi:outer membrane protein insertion porin family